MATLTIQQSRPRPAQRSAAAPRAAGPQAALRLTGRGRLVLAAVALMAMVAGLMLGAGAAFGGTEPVGSSQTIVRSGDTLWSVARSIAPDADPRDVIEQLRRANNLSVDSQLRAGQRLVLPAHLG